MTELGVLALYGLFVLVLILLQVTAALSQVGLSYLVSARDEARVLTGVAGRAVRTVDNSIVALGLIAPAILILQSRSGFTSSTLMATQAFLGARIVYSAVYLAGIPWVRTLIWLVGFGATAFLYISAL